MESLGLHRVVLGSPRGRLGASILTCLQEDPGIQVVATLGRDDMRAAQLEELKPFVFIEAGTAEALAAHWPLIEPLGVPCIVASTALSAGQEAQLEAYATRAPVLIAPNLSIGLNLLKSALRELAALLPSAADISILDVHHRHKRDAPSGTAKALEAAVSPKGDRVVQHACVRAGDVIGEHIVDVFLRHERLSFSHKVEDRRVFGWGAVLAAKRMRTLPPGKYDMETIVKGVL